MLFNLHILLLCVVVLLGLAAALPLDRVGGWVPDCDGGVGSSLATG